ncbi:uncharacterized protein [Dermacentor albipictus]|uniref:uncharacterized protein n=1 Tax=Dermacentor albipictus TaxID=60249 RepID=UPI0038FCA7DF
MPPITLRRSTKATRATSTSIELLARKHRTRVTKILERRKLRRTRSHGQVRLVLPGPDSPLDAGLRCRVRHDCLCCGHLRHADKHGLDDDSRAYALRNGGPAGRDGQRERGLEGRVHKHHPGDHDISHFGGDGWRL